jgi:hypothetical protein
MTPKNTQRSVWALVRRQHGVIARRQLLELALTREAIKHRIAKGRLHPLWPQVYAVGSPHVTPLGLYMAAVLTCGEGAVLSHESAAQLWSIRPLRQHVIEVSLPSNRDPRRKCIPVHRRTDLGEPRHKQGIPVTSPIQTLIDLAPRLSENELERAINEADKLGLASPEQIRRAVSGVHGAGRLRRLLDRQTFVLTDTDLEATLRPDRQEGRFAEAADAGGGQRPPRRLLLRGAEPRRRG